MEGMPLPPPPSPSPSPPPTQCFPPIALYSLYSLYSPPAGVATHDAIRQATGVFFFGGADFFSAKRLFFRAERDVSGERSAPPWAREEIKLKMSFQSLSHSPSHDRAKALTSPPPDFLFSSIPQSHHPPKQKYKKEMRRNAC